jgi:hypothetical protein
MKNYVQVVKKLLGRDIFDELKKAEIGSGIFKPDTRTTVDPEEIRIALQIVPRAVLSYLVANLKSLEIGGNKELNLPFANAQMHVTKISHDVYMGEIYENGKRKTEFKYRSLPGIGLIVMSTFELYDMVDLDKIKEEKIEEEPKMSKLQDIIDQRLKLHCLIKDVVDQRISEREAIRQLIQDKISEAINIKELDTDEDDEDESEDLDIDFSEESEDLEESEEDIMDSISKKSKLKDFLDSREKKRQEKVELDKSEKISCPDCKTNIYKGEDSFKLCLCYGEHYNEKIKVKKTEDGRYKFNFPKSFNTDNVELLLDAIKASKNS